MLVWVIVASVAAIVLLWVAWRIDVKTRRRGGIVGIDEVKLRTKSTPKDFPGGGW